MNGSPCVSPSSSKLDFNKRDQRHCWSRFSFMADFREGTDQNEFFKIYPDHNRAFHLPAI